MTRHSPAWYALRRTLPPWRFDELLAELIAVLPRYQVDEVIVMVDTEEFFHGHPTPDKVREYARNLVKVRDALTESGVGYSLNPWVTRGHDDRRRHSADTLPGIQTVVSADGGHATCVACTLSPVWQENLRQTWRIYAETRPRVLWVEDDIRDFGAHECFCPLHLERFSKIVGETVSREQVTAAMVQPGKPHPWREAWLAMRSAISLEVLRLITGAVQSEAPQTRLGLMSSGPRNHCREERDWMLVAQALGAHDGQPIFSRPTMGNYWEWGPPRGLYFSQDSIKLTRHCLPAATIDYTELENVPFSRYAKSVVFTFAQLVVSCAYGARGTTLNLFDHLGTPMEDEPHYGRMLGARKSYLNALADRAQKPGVYRGLGLIHRANASIVKHLTPGQGLADLGEDGYPALEAFEAAGIPTTYDDAEAVFLCGQQARSLTDDEIRSLLAAGLFLDGSAAEILCERGFAVAIGLTSIESPAPLDSLGAFSAEGFTHPDFGGSPRDHMSAQLPMVNYTAGFALLRPAAGAVVIGNLLDPDALPVHPAMIAFENASGGRVIVHAWDYASAIGPVGVSFHGPVRQRQLQASVRWLCRDQVPVMARGDGAWPLVFRKDCGNESLVGLINLSLDPWPGAEFELAANDSPAGLSVLEPDGSWTPLAGDCCRIRNGVAHLMIERSISLDAPLFIRLQWQAGQSC
ncbi:MAG: hypothetical protein ABIT37_25285 [Luteolibacter sp.]